MLDANKTLLLLGLNGRPWTDGASPITHTHANLVQSFDSEDDLGLMEEQHMKSSKIKNAKAQHIPAKYSGTRPTNKERNSAAPSGRMKRDKNGLLHALEAKKIRHQS